ncbi:X-linked retinitis pigmentosa GTPase regulator-like isoform X2 [Palaemon carinicauda]|uniref:X-linked retinitis pigmentosa GTPase regulator-like isoform X2 n=1 Tax=Palaemon carinicauda TaxID=392227 RepID=UPI0035B5923C
MTADNDFDVPATGAVFTFGKSRFADNSPSKFWIKNDRILELACGDEHTAVVTESGRVFMIGSNDMGQLGLGSTKPVSKPSCVKALKPEKVKHVACGRAHTIVSCASGGVYAWGQNGDGQLGTEDLEDRHSPVLVLEVDIPVISLAAGSTHSALLNENGDVYIWGGNSEGQLGLDVIRQLTPKLLVLKESVVSLACGYYHTVVATESGRAYAWGDSANGRLGLSEKDQPFHRHPQEVRIPEKVVDVAAGSGHTLFLTESGGVFSCGLGTSGQLGQGGAELESLTPQPVVETSTHAIVSIATGDNHSCAVTDNGYLLTWGCGRHGKLCQGEENFASQFVPVVVRRLRHISVVLVGCGGCHTMVLGYRREDEDETATEEEIKQPKSNVLTSIARARRRITDGALPPLKSVGLPPIKQGGVLPTVPDHEDVLEEHEITDVLQIPCESSENGTGQENEASDDENSAAKSNDEDLSVPQKKGGRLARFFGSLGKKKTSSVVETFVITEETEEDKIPEVEIPEPHPLERDTHLESIEDRLNEAGLENKRDVVEAFTENDESSTSSKGKPGHKQSKTCAIL